MQVAADLGHILQQVFLVDDRQVFEGDAAGERSASKGRAVLSRRNRGGKRVFREERPERHSRSDRFRDGHDVRHYAEALEGKDFPGAPEPALDLVEDKRRVMMIGQGPAGKQELLRTLEDSAFSKDWFEHDRAGIGANGCVKRFDVVLGYKGD